MPNTIEVTPPFTWRLDCRTSSRRPISSSVGHLRHTEWCRDVLETSDSLGSLAAMLYQAHDAAFGEKTPQTFPYMRRGASSTQAVIYSRQVTRIGTPQLTPYSAQPLVLLTHLRPDFRVRVSNGPPFPGLHSIQTREDEDVELFAYTALQDITSAASKIWMIPDATCEFVFRAGKDTIASSARVNYYLSPGPALHPYSASRSPTCSASLHPRGFLDEVALTSDIPMFCHNSLLTVSFLLYVVSLALPASYYRSTCCACCTFVPLLDKKAGAALKSVLSTQFIWVEILFSLRMTHVLPFPISNYLGSRKTVPHLNARLTRTICHRLARAHDSSSVMNHPLGSCTTTCNNSRRARPPSERRCRGAW
ncbi:hypothetical protein BDW22DRAFT_1348941 [Trametopsis cervina]|nr:hypothetical protein BDW22DRAFT_1348941 [Trametopsis cervina]